MASVTNRISEIKQPRGGYIRPSQLEVYEMNDNEVLFAEENIHPTIVGMTVDYLTRLCMGAKPTDAFSISLKGAVIASLFGAAKAQTTAYKLLNNIRGTDNKSIINACKLTAFDVWVRNTLLATKSKGYADINPDIDTVQNIRTMVNRSITFWNEYGPITKDGFTFEKDGYTDVVNSGDGDFLTKDTLWDFKVSKNKPTSKHTLQILMYWIMGQHSKKPEFKGVTNIGIFNPRLNTVYTLPISKIDSSIIETIEREVICYNT